MGSSTALYIEAKRETSTVFAAPAPGGAESALQWGVFPYFLSGSWRQYMGGPLQSLQVMTEAGVNF